MLNSAEHSCNFKNLHLFTIRDYWSRLHSVLNIGNRGSQCSIRNDVWCYLFSFLLYWFLVHLQWLSYKVFYSLSHLSIDNALVLGRYGDYFSNHSIFSLYLLRNNCCDLRLCWLPVWYLSTSLFYVDLFHHRIYLCHFSLNNRELYHRCLWNAVKSADYYSKLFCHRLWSSYFHGKHQQCDSLGRPD